MDAKKLAKLTEQLNNQTPLLGERIRQQAAKQLAEIKTPETNKLLAQTLEFSKDQNVKNIIVNCLRNIKFQDQKSIDVICEVWAKNRHPELGSLIKLKGWVASKPLKLKILVALRTNWPGVIKEEGIAVIPTLLSLLNDPQTKIANRAREWLSSLQEQELQKELCRIAVEENNDQALEIANETQYISEFLTEAVLFYFLKEKWDEYRKVDPEQQLLTDIYYSASQDVRQRIDEVGQSSRRVEWVWAILGGKETKRIASIKDYQWQKIINILTSGRHWQEMWTLAFISPIVWSITIIKKLEQKKWLPKTPNEKLSFNHWRQLVQKCSLHPPQGKLISLIETFKGHTRPIEAMLITPNSKLVISAGGNLIRVWSLPQQKLVKTLKAHLKSVTSLALSEDGKLLASSSRDKTLCVWRLPQGNLVQTFSNHSASAWCLAMTKDGNLLASGSYQETRLWQYATGRLFKTLTNHQREVQSLVISPDDSLLVTAGGDNDGRINLWQLPDGQHLQTLQAHQQGTWCLAISPNNNLLVTAGKDYLINLWRLPTGEKITTLEGHTGAIWCLAISPDGKILATGSNDQTIKLWKLPTGKLLTTLEGHTGAIWSLTINPQGDLLVTGSKDQTIRLWSLPDGEMITTLTGHDQPIKCLQVSPNGEALISASDDQTLRLWNWHLPHLAKTPISLLTRDDQKWIQDNLTNSDITENERNWLNFMSKLMEHHHQQNQLTFAEKETQPDQ